MDKPVYEALINGSEIDTIDPIVSVKVVINNGYYEYEYGPDEVKTIEIRKRK